MAGRCVWGDDDDKDGSYGIRVVDTNGDYGSEGDDFTNGGHGSEGGDGNGGGYGTQGGNDIVFFFGYGSWGGGDGGGYGSKGRGDNGGDGTNGIDGIGNYW